MPNQFNVTFPVKHLLIKQLHDLTQKLSLSLYGRFPLKNYFRNELFIFAPFVNFHQNKNSLFLLTSARCWTSLRPSNPCHTTVAAFYNLLKFWVQISTIQQPKELLALNSRNYNELRILCFVQHFSFSRKLSLITCFVYWKSFQWTLIQNVLPVRHQHHRAACPVQRLVCNLRTLSLLKIMCCRPTDSPSILICNCKVLLTYSNLFEIYLPNRFAPFGR